MKTATVMYFTRIPGKIFARCNCWPAPSIGINWDNHKTAPKRSEDGLLVIYNSVIIIQTLRKEP